MSMNINRSSGETRIARTVPRRHFAGRWLEFESTGSRRMRLAPGIKNGCGQRKAFMRYLVFALLVTRGFAILGAAPAGAVGTRYPANT